MLIVTEFIDLFSSTSTMVYLKHDGNGSRREEIRKFNRRIFCTPSYSRCDCVYIICDKDEIPHLIKVRLKRIY